MEDKMREAIRKVDLEAQEYVVKHGKEATKRATVQAVLRAGNELFDFYANDTEDERDVICLAIACADVMNHINRLSYALKNHTSQQFMSLCANCAEQLRSMGK